MERDPRIPPPRRVEQPAPDMPPRTGQMVFCCAMRRGQPHNFSYCERDFSHWVTPAALAVAILEGWVWL